MHNQARELVLWASGPLGLWSSGPPVLWAEVWWPLPNYKGYRVAIETFTAATLLLLFPICHHLLVTTVSVGHTSPYPLMRLGMQGYKSTTGRIFCHFHFMMHYQHGWRVLGPKILKIKFLLILRSHSSEPLPPTAKTLPYLSSAQQDLTNKPQENL